MTDEPRQRFAVAVVDELVGHQTLVRWFDLRADAERMVAERYAGNAVIIVASGIIGPAFDHDVPVRRST